MLDYTVLQRITNNLWNYEPEKDDIEEKVLLSLSYINLYKLSIEDMRNSEDIFNKIEDNIFSKGRNDDLLTIDRSNLSKSDVYLLLLYYRFLNHKNIKELENYVNEIQEDIININLEDLKFINFQILYFVYKRTLDIRYKNKILEVIEEKLDSIDDYQFYILLYLLTRNSDYLAPAYTLVEPITDLSKDETLDFYIWQISGFDENYYPVSLGLRRHILENMINELNSAQALFLASSFALGEIDRWRKDIFGDYTPIINENLEILIDPMNNIGILGRTRGFHKKIGQRGLLYFGKVCEKPEQSLGHFGRDVYIDCVKPHVIFICGHRGSGKSYTMGVIAEELAKTQVGIGTIIVDPMGIFWSMKFPNWTEKEIEGLKKWNIKPKSFRDSVKVFVPLGYYNSCSEATRDEAFSLLPSELTADDWCYTFDIDRFSPRGILIEKAINLVKEGYTDEFGIPVPRMGDFFTLQDIIDCIQDSRMLNSKSKGFNIRTRRAVVSRLQIAKDWGIFSNTGTKLSEISVPNQISVIDVSFLDEDLRSLIIGILSRKILKERLKISRRRDAAKVDMNIQTEAGINEIPVTWLLIDEAHLLIPNKGKTAASEPLIQYAKLGRKPGCGLILVTQQPAATNSQILSQLDILLSHLLTYKSDITALVSRIPGDIPKEIDKTRFFRSMAVGSGIIADESINTSRCFTLRIRPRSSQHAGRESLPKIIDSMEEPVLPPELTEESADSMTEEVGESASEDSIESEDFIEVVSGETSDLVDINAESEDAVSASPEQITEINLEMDTSDNQKIEKIQDVVIDLPLQALKAYNKRFLTYRFYQFLFSFKERAYSTDISEEITEEPSKFLKKAISFLNNKRFNLDQIHHQTELPVILFQKQDIKLAITASKSKSKNVGTLIAVTTDNNKLDDLKKLLEEIKSVSYLEI
ncbi:MAG: ATP-binding protein [Promethearchaeota archaeon]|nr:MAG: ATP-binding protein [Candidatus Lokiarchaeota archaeon]